ncbi:MAG: TIGR04255 family protein [Candidatus Obscuribacterales bacterium]
MSIHYPQAPIVEAIIDIRVPQHEDSEISKLKQLCSELQGKFPTRRDLKVFQSVLNIDGGTSTATTSNQQTGFILTSADTRNLLQLRLDGFAYTILPPYSNWQTFQESARALWTLYREAMSASNPVRVGLRYLNRIDIPLPVRDVRDFLRTYPEISSDMDQAITGYLMQLQCPQPQIDALAVITQAIVAPPRPDVVSIILDIDVARSVNLPSEDSQIWELFEQLRYHKNSIFEASITNRARELFK